MSSFVKGSSDPKKEQANSSSLLLYIFLLGILPLWLVITHSTGIDASDDLWIAVPFFGYVRYDMAYIGICGIQLPLLFVLLQGVFDPKERGGIFWKITAVMWMLHIATPVLPASFFPAVDMRDPIAIVEMEMELQSTVGTGQIIQGHKTGPTLDQVKQFIDLAWANRDDWTHVTKSVCIGYFQYGPSHNFDRDESPKNYLSPTLSWSFVFGVEPMRPRRIARESMFRLRYPEQRDRVVAEFRKEFLPSLKAIYARTLGTEPSNIIFGDDYVTGLGVPAFTILMPSFPFSMAVNGHNDLTYGGVFDSITAMNRDPRPFSCTPERYNAIDPKTGEGAIKIKTVLIPLSFPDGAGLRFWTSESGIAANYSDIDYEPGHVYTFDAAATHAIRPLPYRGHDSATQLRYTVQAFAVRCTEEEHRNWILFH